jgi:acyl carrier protein
MNSSLAAIKSVMRDLDYHVDHSSDLDQSFYDYGLDSIELAKLRDALSCMLRVSLPATLLFDYPTIRSLEQYLDSILNEHKDVLPVQLECSMSPTSAEFSVIACAMDDLGYDLDPNSDLDQSFSDYGLDSMELVRMRDMLSSRLDQDLPATVLFDYPTILSLEQYLKSVSHRQSSRSMCESSITLEAARKSNREGARQKAKEKVTTLRERPNPFGRKGCTQNRKHAEAGEKMLKQANRVEFSAKAHKQGRQVDVSIRSWRSVSAGQLLAIQEACRKAYAHPEYQRRFTKLATKCQPDMCKYIKAVEPILVEVEGLVFMEHGLVDSLDAGVIQKSRKEMTATVMKHWRKVPEVRRLGLELIRLTKQDKSW